MLLAGGAVCAQAFVAAPLSSTSRGAVGPQRTTGSNVRMASVSELPSQVSVGGKLDLGDAKSMCLARFVES